MNQSNDFREQPAVSCESPTLRVFVAFEDIKTRVEAWQLYRHLADDLARDIELTSVFCNFDVVEAGKASDETTLAVAQADLILFSINEGFQLNGRVKSWIESWVKHRRVDDGGLFLLFEHSAIAPIEPSSNQVYLRGVAERAGMEFLCQTVAMAAPLEVSPNGREFTNMSRTEAIGSSELHPRAGAGMKD